MSSNLIAAENLAQAIRQVARKAHSEEDLRVGVERALSATLQTRGGCWRSWGEGWNH
jgi:hypothetical protein